MSEITQPKNTSNACWKREAVTKQKIYNDNEFKKNQESENWANWQIVVQNDGSVDDVKCKQHPQFQNTHEVMLKWIKRHRHFDEDHEKWHRQETCMAINTQQFC